MTFGSDTEFSGGLAFGESEAAPGDGSINLIAVNGTQANLSSGGAISVNGAIVNLAAADSTQDNTSSSGAIYLSDLPPDALPGYTAVAQLRRAAKPTAFDVKDPDEVIWIAFDFRHLTSSVSNASVTVTRFSGAADADPAAILQGSPVIVGPKALHRVQAGVDACTYHFECLVTAADGSRYSLAAFLPVRSA